MAKKAIHDGTSLPHITGRRVVKPKPKPKAPETPKPTEAKPTETKPVEVDDKRETFAGTGSPKEGKEAPKEKDLADTE